MIVAAGAAVTVQAFVDEEILVAVDGQAAMDSGEKVAAAEKLAAGVGVVDFEGDAVMTEAVDVKELEKSERVVDFAVALEPGDGTAVNSYPRYLKLVV